MGHNDRLVPGLICQDDLCKIKEAVCIFTKKVYDACRDKDCIEDAKVFFRDPRKIECLLRRAINVKVVKADVIDVFADVEEVPFKRGFYTVDVKFFICVTLDFFVPRCNGGTRIVTVHGLVTHDKKVILFGSEGNVKIFKSYLGENRVESPFGSEVEQDNLPISLVEVAEPIALNAKIVELCGCGEIGGFDQLPDRLVSHIENKGLLDDDIEEFNEGHDDDDPRRIVVVTLGLFSIIKLVRNVQLMIPAFDFCVPNKKCIGSEEDPCEFFETIEFPEDEFFPPQKFDFPGAEETERGIYDKK